MQGDDGDIPLLELDYLNAPVNTFTGMSWGDHHRLWYGWLNEEEEEPERAEKVGFELYISVSFSYLLHYHFEQ